MAPGIDLPSPSSPTHQLKDRCIRKHSPWTAGRDKKKNKPHLSRHPIDPPYCDETLEEESRDYEMDEEMAQVLEGFESLDMGVLARDSERARSQQPQPDGLTSMASAPSGSLFWGQPGSGSNSQGQALAIHSSFTTTIGGGPRRKVYSNRNCSQRLDSCFLDNKGSPLGGNPVAFSSDHENSSPRAPASFFFTAAGPDVCQLRPKSSGHCDNNQGQSRVALQPLQPSAIDQGATSAASRPTSNNVDANLQGASSGPTLFESPQAAKPRAHRRSGSNHGASAADKQLIDSAEAFLGRSAFSASGACVGTAAGSVEQPASGTFFEGASLEPCKSLSPSTHATAKHNHGHHPHYMHSQLQNHSFHQHAPLSQSHAVLGFGLPSRHSSANGSAQLPTLSASAPSLAALGPLASAFTTGGGIPCAGTSTASGALAGIPGFGVPSATLAPALSASSRVFCRGDQSTCVQSQLADSAEDLRLMRFARNGGPTASGQPDGSAAAVAATGRSARQIGQDVQGGDDEVTPQRPAVHHHLSADPHPARMPAPTPASGNAPEPQATGGVLAQQLLLPAATIARCRQLLCQQHSDAARHLPPVQGHGHGCGGDDLDLELDQGGDEDADLHLDPSEEWLRTSQQGPEDPESGGKYSHTLRMRVCAAAQAEDGACGHGWLLQQGSGSSGMPTSASFQKKLRRRVSPHHNNHRERATRRGAPAGSPWPPSAHGAGATRSAGATPGAAGGNCMPGRRRSGRHAGGYMSTPDHGNDDYAMDELERFGGQLTRGSPGLSTGGGSLQGFRLHSAVELGQPSPGDAFLDRLMDYDDDGTEYSTPPHTPLRGVGSGQQQHQHPNNQQHLHPAAVHPGCRTVLVRHQRVSFGDVMAVDHGAASLYIPPVECLQTVKEFNVQLALAADMGDRGRADALWRGMLSASLAPDVGTLNSLLRCLARTAAHPDEAERLTRSVCEAGEVSPNNTTSSLLKEISFRFEQLYACC